MAQHETAQRKLQVRSTLSCFVVTIIMYLQISLIMQSQYTRFSKTLSLSRRIYSNWYKNRTWNHETQTGIRFLISLFSAIPISITNVPSKSLFLSIYLFIQFFSNDCFTFVRRVIYSFFLKSHFVIMSVFLLFNFFTKKNFSRRCEAHAKHQSIHPTTKYSTELIFKLILPSLLFYFMVHQKICSVHIHHKKKISPWINLSYLLKTTGGEVSIYLRGNKINMKNVIQTVSVKRTH